MIKLCAKCPNEIVPLVALELAELGAQDIEETYKAVYFTTDERGYYDVHLKARLPSRIYRIIKTVPAQSPTIIFDKVKRIRFCDYFNAEDAVHVDVTNADKDGDIPTDVIGSKLREAMRDSFEHFAKKTPNPSSRDANITLSGFLRNRRLMLGIDTSLKSLHKRGYRMEGHPAPLKETLASTLLRLCEYRGERALYDPMCGSGSIIIEGAQIAMKKAPLIHRKKGEFGFEHLNDFNRNLWKQVQDEARAQQREPKCGLYASDIDETFVNLAKETALAARVEKYIDFRQADFFETSKPEDEGLMIANLPYGLRLDEHEIDKDYLRKVGAHIKEHFQGWTCGFLLPSSAPFKEFGLKASGKIDLVNGAVNVKFVVFDVY